MFVLCPHCQFLVALEPASGQPPARCPRCEASLQAQPGDAIAADAPMPLEVHPAAPAQVRDDARRHSIDARSPAPADHDHVDTDHGAHAEPETDDDAAIDVVIASADVAVAHPPRSTRRRAPSFVHAPATHPPSTPHRRWRTTTAVFGLLALLLLQIALADRAQFAADPRWRGPLSTLCRALRCTLPAWHEPAAFTLVDRDVRPEPAMAGTLRVTASFRNDARWPQPWPSLLLTLSDVDGRVVGARLFAPREYLGAPPTQAGLASGQSASIVMAVREPAPDVVAFNFDFR